MAACSNENSNNSNTTGRQQEWFLASFQKVDSANPVMAADSSLRFYCPIQKNEIKWAEKDVFNPAAIVRNDTLFLLFRAEDKIGKYAGTSRIGLAWSTDGLHFQKYPKPVLYPDNDVYKFLEWEGGCEDPRVVEDSSGVYYMTYTAYDGDKARLMVASSPDLYHWTKHGLAFAKAHDEKYAKGWSKSGSIISSYKNGKIIATKINGKYWMLWGDQNIWIATSDNLIDWEPVLRKAGEDTVENVRGIAKDFPELKTVIAPRKGKFDSDLVEPGPPAMITDSGILFIYNSRNIPSIGDTSLAEGTYAAGQVLLDKNDPSKPLKRMNTYFIKPEKPYEVSGQVNHVCFVEGLVRYKERWFLYYGTADSKIAVAVME
jgi:predicted GH43/DUF377 family glycosyl hydrolase